MPEKRGIVETMTMEELLKLFRSYGISCTYYKIRALVIQNVFPFAYAIEGECNNTEFFILKKDAIDWLEERVTA